MELVIEAMDESGPLGLPSISVCHYGEQNGDLMRDPEMCFEVVCAEDRTLSLNPWYYRNDYFAREQWSRNIVRGQYVCVPSLHEQHESFAETWDNNLRLQGFLEAFTDKCILGYERAMLAESGGTAADRTKPELASAGFVAGVGPRF